MADTKLPVFNNDGQTAYIDMRSESTNGEGRQVVAIGDPDTNDNVMDVVSGTYGKLALVIQPHDSSALSDGASNGTEGPADENFNRLYYPVYLFGLDSTGTWTRIGVGGGVADRAMRVVQATDVASSIKIVGVGTTDTLGIYLAQTAGTLQIKLDPDSTLGGIRNTIAIHLQTTGGTILTKLDSDSTLGGIRNTVAIYLHSTAGTQIVKLDPDSTLGGIRNTIGVYLQSSAGTTVVKLAPESAGIARDDTAYTAGTSMGTPMMAVFDDTAPDSVDENDFGIVRMTGNRIQMVHTDSTASIFVASGTANGVSVSGNTIISPSANASYKIYAYSILTTGQVSLTTKFTNGSGTSPTEFWRPLVTASGVTGVQGANLTTMPSAPLFVTGTSTTLSLVLDSATLVHYSVAYTKESA